MAEIPRGAVTLDAEVALELECADGLLRVAVDGDGVEPERERKVRVVEQGPRGRRELVLAHRLKAVVDVALFGNRARLAVLDRGDDSGHTVTPAGEASERARPPGLFEVRKALFLRAQVLRNVYQARHIDLYVVCPGYVPVSSA
jgi:hypothetical protein